MAKCGANVKEVPPNGMLLIISLLFLIVIGIPLCPIEYFYHRGHREHRGHSAGREQRGITP
jgi:hypothetical protein